MRLIKWLRRIFRFHGLHDCSRLRCKGDYYSGSEHMIFFCIKENCGAKRPKVRHPTLKYWTELP